MEHARGTGRRGGSIGGRGGRDGGSRGGPYRGGGGRPYSSRSVKWDACYVFDVWIIISTSISQPSLH